MVTGLRASSPVSSGPLRPLRGGKAAGSAADLATNLSPVPAPPEEFAQGKLATAPDAPDTGAEVGTSRPARRPARPGSGDSRPIGSVSAGCSRVARSAEMAASREIRSRKCSCAPSVCTSRGTAFWRGWSGSKKYSFAGKRAPPPRFASAALTGAAAGCGMSPDGREMAPPFSALFPAAVVLPSAPAIISVEGRSRGPAKSRAEFADGGPDAPSDRAEPPIAATIGDLTRRKFDISPVLSGSAGRIDLGCFTSLDLASLDGIVSAGTAARRGDTLWVELP